jgi:hypothetical protein
MVLLQVSRKIEYVIQIPPALGLSLQHERIPTEYQTAEPE